MERFDESLSLVIGLGPVGTGSFGFQTHCAAGFSPLLGAVSAAVVRQHPAARDALAVEPAHSSHQEAHRGGLLLIGQHLDVRQSDGVIHSQGHILMASTRRAAQAPITSDAVADAFKAGQLFGGDVDHVAWLLPLVTANSFLGLQVLETSQTHGLEPASGGGQWCGQSFGDATHGAALVPERCGLLRLLWIERPPPSAANTASSHQCRWTA